MMNSLRNTQNKNCKVNKTIFLMNKKTKKNYQLLLHYWKINMKRNSILIRLLHRAVKKRFKNTDLWDLTHQVTCY